MTLVRELLEGKSLSRVDVVMWFDAKRKSKMIDNYTNETIARKSFVDSTPPYKISCNRFDPSATFYKNRSPYYFGHIENLIIDDKASAHIRSLKQLNTDSCTVLKLRNAPITTLDGCPAEITHLVLDKCENLSTLNGIPKTVNMLDIYYVKSLTEIDVDLPNVMRLHATASGLTNLKNIHKKCPNLEYLQINSCENITSHILGLAKLPKLQTLIYRNMIWSKEKNSGQTKALEIIHNGIMNKRDAFDIQEELIDAGLEEYAQL